MKQKILSLLALLLTAATGAWAQDTYTVTFKANGNTKTVENVTLPHTFELDPIIKELYPSLSGGNGSPAGTSASGNSNVTAYHNNSKHYASISAPFEGAVTVTGQFFKDFTNHQYTLEINCMEELVAISDDKTEATIKMPKYDVTATYTIKRDMTVDVAGEMADRIRIKKDGNDYQAVDATQMNPVVKDNLETNSPVTLTVTTDYTLQLQKQSETNADEWTDATALSVGNFRYKITGAGNYSGICYSEEFALFEGYEIKVAAGEYATFYKDEPLYADTETSADAVLYTVSSVSADKAVLSSAITTAPSNTPLLVYNSGEEDNTFLLIPADAEPNLALTVAPEFVGTLEATTIAASTEALNNYALNGKQFVWVMNAIPVAANKCWLQIPNGEPTARNISIVFGDATGIDSMVNGQWSMDTWYDLNGRKLQAAPTKKGVYLFNGKKVVVK